MKTLDAVATAIRSGTIQQLEESRRTSQETERSAKLLQRDLIENLWLLMARLYGHKWTSQFSDQVDPGNVWAACLRGISPEQIRFGMSELVRQQCEWPPSAPEFRGMCTGETSVSWEHKRQAHSVHEALGYEPLGLPNITAREAHREKQKSRMAQLRAETGI